MWRTLAVFFRSVSGHELERRTFVTCVALRRKSHLADLQLESRPIHYVLNEEIAKHGADVAMIDGADATRRVSYADITSTALRLSSALWRHDRLAKDDVVSVFLPNCIAYPSLYLAVWQRGAVCSPVNFVYTEHELLHHLEDCGAKMIFTTNDAVLKVTSATKRLKKPIQSCWWPENYDSLKLRGQLLRVQRIVTMDSKPIAKEPPSKLVISLDEYIATSSSDEPDAPDVEIDPRTDRALLPYSSGTTGPPKGVELSHYGLNALLRCFNDSRLCRLPGKGDFVPTFLPMFHIYGFAAMFATLVNGGKVVVMSHFDKDQFLSIIQEYKVRHIFAVPPVLVMLAKDPTVDRYDISSLESVFVGAAPVPAEICHQLMDKHPSVKHLCQGYGMTEVGISHAELPKTKDEIRFGSCGQLAANFECKIMDISTKKELGLNERGELWIRGPAVMLGYLHRPDATVETIDTDGWLHTGDIGYVDKDGYYYIVDRLKELIKVKGFQDVLLSHEAVQDAAVIGVPDEVSGETPRAYVVLNTQAHLSADDVHAFVNERVSHYKRLKGGIEFVSQIPKAASGKLLRRVLKDEYMSSLKDSRLRNI